MSLSKLQLASVSYSESHLVASSLGDLHRTHRVTEQVEQVEHFEHSETSNTLSTNGNGFSKLDEISRQLPFGISAFDFDCSRIQSEDQIPHDGPSVYTLCLHD